MKRTSVNKVLRLHDKVSGGMGSSVKDQKAIAKEAGLRTDVVSEIIQIHEDNNYTRDSQFILDKLTNK